MPLLQKIKFYYKPNVIDIDVTTVMLMTWKSCYCEF